MHCSRCAKPLRGGDQRFCPECGSPVPLLPAAPPAPVPSTFSSGLTVQQTSVLIAGVVLLVMALRATNELSALFALAFLVVAWFTLTNEDLTPRYKTAVVALGFLFLLLSNAIEGWQQRRVGMQRAGQVNALGTWKEEDSPKAGYSRQTSSQPGTVCMDSVPPTPGAASASTLCLNSSPMPNFPPLALLSIHHGQFACKTRCSVSIRSGQAAALTFPAVPVDDTPPITVLSIGSDTGDGIQPYLINSRHFTIKACGRTFGFNTDPRLRRR
jgi:hypothetical protein